MTFLNAQWVCLSKFNLYYTLDPKESKEGDEKKNSKQKKTPEQTIPTPHAAPPSEEKGFYIKQYKNFSTVWERNGLKKADPDM